MTSCPEKGPSKTILHYAGIYGLRAFLFRTMEKKLPQAWNVHGLFFLIAKLWVETWQKKLTDTTFSFYLLPYVSRMWHVSLMWEDRACAPVPGPRIPPTQPSVARGHRYGYRHPHSLVQWWEVLLRATVPRNRAPLNTIFRCILSADRDTFGR